MKIALVAPSPVPFLIGGAENLWSGWIAALNRQAGVEADLIKLPTPERNFWEIVDSYRRWAGLDLSHFDRVISTKYPAWMVAHEDHHVFLQHKLRGLYDTWPARLETTVSCDAPVVRQLLEVLERSRGERGALAEIFAALDALRAAEGELPAGLFALPGALLRRCVHALDAIGLAPGAIRRYAAISATVRSRADYFPPGVEVEVIHHPSLPRPEREPCPAVPDGAIFTASRLDKPKRLELVIKAWRAAQIEVPLVIAGDGPQRAALETLAGDEPNIHLVGRLTDAELADAYPRALFVPFVPDREDYGLITLEALQAGRPVLSCSDAGGVTELVRDGENGLITAPTPAALGAAMRRLVADPALCARLAARARDSVAHIDWTDLAARFSTPWPHLVVVNTFPIYPAHNGGQLRMLSLYRQLCRHARITVVNLAPGRSHPQRRQLAPGLHEVLVPMSAAHARFESELKSTLRASCTDIAAMLKPELTPAWQEAIRAALAESTPENTLALACHPYGWPALQDCWDGPVVYESLNVEADLKAAIFPHAAGYIEQVRQVEAACSRRAAAVLCCSAEDAARMQTLHGLQQRPQVVANGVNAASYPALEPAARAQLRSRLGLGPRAKVALFVGSLHGPNIDAVRTLCGWASQCATISLVVLGSVCEAEGLPTLPANVHLLGRVSDAELRVWLAAADIGINPIVSGSGTNLKLLEYAAAGLPILSTPFGGRGGILSPGEHFHQAAIEAFPEALTSLMENEDELNQYRVAARAQANSAGDWQHIAHEMWQVLQGVLERNRLDRALPD